MEKMHIFGKIRRVLSDAYYFKMRIGNGNCIHVSLILKNVSVKHNIIQYQYYFLKNTYLIIKGIFLDRKEIKYNFCIANLQNFL